MAFTLIIVGCKRASWLRWDERRGLTELNRKDLPITLKLKKFFYNMAGKCHTKSIQDKHTKYG